MHHTSTCKSQWIIYFLQCTLCNLQYTGKLHSRFNNRLNNHQKDESNQKAIQACFHYRKEGHNVIQHAKFALIGQITESENVSKATFKTSLKTGEDFWILTL